MHLRRCPGFSLVELLVAIVIIAILATVIVPTVSSLKTKSELTQCANNLRQLGAAFLMYANTNELHAPNQPSGVAAPGNGLTYWEKLAPYAGEELPARASDTAAAGSIMHCPSHTEYPGAFSYFANRFIITPNDKIRIDAIERPDKKVLFYEVHTRMQWAIASYYAGGTGKAPFFPPFTHHAHHSGSNFVFADGHVEFTNTSLNHEPTHWTPW